MKALKIALVLSILMLASVAQAIQIGPAPTSSRLNGDGTFTVSSATASASSSGFAGGTIYYPTSTAQKYGVIAVCPGFTGTKSSIAWFARRLATYGFVTVAMNTQTIYDYPDSRATQ